MRVRLITFAFILLALLGLTLLLTGLWGDGVPATNNVQTQGATAVLEEESPPAQADVSYTDGRSPTQSVKGSDDIGAWAPMGTTEQERVVREWFESRGNYQFQHPDYVNDYHSYSLDTLIELSEAGDIRALHHLAEKTDDLDEKRVILERAAAFGSTQALNRIGSIIEAQGRLYSDQVDEEQRRAVILEAMPYHHAAALRGDWWGLINYADPLLQRHDIALTEQEKVFVENRSQAIYDELQDQRHQLNRGDFDDEVPDEVMDFYNEMTRPLE